MHLETHPTAPGACNESKSKTEQPAKLRICPEGARCFKGLLRPPQKRLRDTPPARWRPACRRWSCQGPAGRRRELRSSSCLWRAAVAMACFSTVPSWHKDAWLLGCVFPSTAQLAGEWPQSKD